MKKKWFLIGLSVLFGALPADDMMAQGFLDKVVRGLEKTNEVMESADRLFGGQNAQRSRRKAVKGSRIESPHPDLEISCHVEGTVPSCSVPPLITEIPISNMFKHGITEAGEGRVRVDFILNDPSCFKMVCRNRIREDSVFFANPASMGISILRDRLDALYGKSASFHLEREGNEAVAVLTIPF